MTNSAVAETGGNKLAVTKVKGVLDPETSAKIALYPREQIRYDRGATVAAGPQDWTQAPAGAPAPSV